MVDVDTALRANAYNDRKRRSGGDKKDSKNTPKRIEDFDPAAHAVKEIADAYSMWLVIIYGMAVALGIRARRHIISSPSTIVCNNNTYS